MQLSQSALFQLCCASFFAGVLLSFFCDFLYTMRLWLMPSHLRYTVPTIQKLCAARIMKKGKGKGWGLQVATFFGDVFLCLASALTLILLLYWLNNGAFRAAAPLCMAFGFYFCHISLSKGVRWGFQWVVFGTEMLVYTLLRPLKYLFGIIVEKHKKNAQKRHIKCLAKQRQIYTKQELQHLEKAAMRLLPIDLKSRMQKGDDHATKSKKAV